MYINVTVLTVDLAALQVPASVKHDPDPVYIRQLPSRTLLSFLLSLRAQWRRSVRSGHLPGIVKTISDS
jgi:hypothetical protein